MKLNVKFSITIVILITITFLFIPCQFISAESQSTNIEKNVISKSPVQDIIVYCDYYTWWCNSKWNKGNSNCPLLGFYNSLDPGVLKEHSRLANEYGIDVFKVEYVPALDSTIIDGILKTDLGNTRVCLMYDTLIRFSALGKGKPPYNFNDPEIYNTFIEDMNHIADVYFSNPNYFNINGRPVLWIYITREMYGNWKSAISTARQNMNSKGFDVYLVGDQVFWNYNYDGIELFDAVSTYHAYAGGPQNTSAFADRLKTLYSRWKKIAQSRGKDFIPGALPAYDDTCMSHSRECVPPLYGTKEDFNYMLRVVSNYLDNVNGAENLTQVTIATFNENQEGSSIEPSLEWGYDRISQIPVIFGNN
jgi:hypothetical protein